MLQPQIIQLPKLGDRRGNLSFIEEEKHIPFKIRRSYWIYDVPGGESRGGHAYYENEEFIVALSGAFDVVLYDGKKEYVYNLSRSYYGLYVPKNWWREMRNFSTNAVGLILASTAHSTEDYNRDFELFKKERSIV